MRQIHIDRAIEQAAAWGHEYVVLFGREDGNSEDLEFLETFRDEHDMNIGRYKWNHSFTPNYRTRRVYDVDYWIDKG